MSSKNVNSSKYPISSNSRSKLNAFRYDKQDETAVNATSLQTSKPRSPSKTNHADKENQESWLNGVVETGHSELNEAKPHADVDVDKPESTPAKECPQTPANRIPLADLIGNAEDAINQAPMPEYTPEDYVIWQHVPASSNPDTMSQTSTTQGKKRRHIPSPTSSPLAGNSKGSRKKSFDMQAIQGVLRTPQQDLATELWNNYVSKITANGNGIVPQARFAHLLSSSPQTPPTARTGRDSSGLRRSASCNAEWPSSKTKRRKIGGNNIGSGRGIFSRTRSNVVESGGINSSKINFLMETIEKSLQEAPAQPPASGLSPVPVRKVCQRGRSASPIQSRRPHHQLPAEDGEEELGETYTEQRDKQQSSSEFGDDDFDQDLFDIAEASIDPFVEPSMHHSQAGASNFKRGTASFSTTTGNQLNKQPSPFLDAASAKATVDSNANNDYDIDADVFDDDEFDEFSDDIEDILAECEATPSNKHVRFTLGDNSASLSRSRPGSLSEEAKPLKETKPEEESSDEFDDDFDMEAIEQSMKNSGADESHNNFSRQAIKRYLIIDIAESTFTTQRGRVQPEKVLMVQDERTKQQRVVILRDSWFESPCSKDSYIHLIGEFDSAGHCIVDDSQNMIILHPDHLISATIVADSIGCQRRAVLQDRIKNTGDIGKPQVFGNIFHEIFQEAMKLNQWDMASLKSLVEAVTVKHIEELYLIHMSIPEAVDYVMGKIPALRAWAENFLRTKPNANSLVEDRNSSKLRLSITKLLEVEEHVWSPMYGLKGNIDATVQVACQDAEGDKNLIVPLELKTGNRDTNHAHRAQTALYTLLLSDRYDVEVTFGLLYYLETSKIFRIRGIRHELLQMVQARNRVAGYMCQRTQLPPMVKRQALCNKCFSKTPCFVYHKLIDDGDGETSGLGDEFVKNVDHLTPKDRDFFRKWDDLLTKEEQSMMKFKRELWTLLSSEREALGRCFGDIVLEPGSAFEDKEGLKINRYRYTFIKRQPTPTFSFTESQLTVGEPIVISDEKGHFALANGYVVQVSPKRISVAVDRRLHNARIRGKGFDVKTNQTFQGIMEIAGPDSTPAMPDEPGEELVYRLDKDEFSNGMAIVRANLIAMMERDLFQAKNLRRLIVEGAAPVFQSRLSAYKMPDADRASLNIDQKQAIDKVMTAQDYALVLGMPGTGKTTTIAHIIRTLVAQGKSVLLTSYTHTAVDNILLKIRDDNIRTLRIGAAAKVHPEVQQFADMAATPKKTIEELKAAYEDSQIVATTCLGISHSVFSQRVFDYCIVDEASQITLPVCLGPIRMARTFILVGDHYQLPPLVQNKEAQEGGLDVSLFKLLSDTHPASVVNLEHQYRMCKEIMLLSNTLIYSGHLKCGTEEVARRSLEIPDIGGLKQHHMRQFPPSPGRRQLCQGASHGRCWLQDLIDPSAKTRLVNTDTLGTPARDTASGSRIVNPTEAMICAQIVEAFISCGIPARSIGVITFYRSQLSLLKQNLRHHLPELEMHTADKFQGRDKEVVVLSCVRSNAENHVGDLLRDWRRVNVAFTRARTKLLVVGSKGTLRGGNELLAKYVRLVQEQGWIYDLPKGAMESHTFEHDSMLHVQTQPQDRSAPCPSGSPTSQKARKPLSPTQARGPQGLKKPAKKGAKLVSGTKILGNRPILQDVVNDLIG